MVLWLSGCFLFIGSGEHATRQAELSDDTGDPIDSGDPIEATPYAGTYDGPLTIEIDLPGDSKCVGKMSLFISYKGNLNGDGYCSFTSLDDMTIDIQGVVKGDLAGGVISVNKSQQDTWSGTFYTNGPDSQLQGTFSGTTTISGVERDYSGGFVVD